MELAKSTISNALIRQGYPALTWNVMTIEDALQWEDRDDYDTLKDLLDAVIEGNKDDLKSN